MAESSIDRIATALAARRGTRRTALGGGIGLAAVAASRRLSGARAQEATPAQSEELTGNLADDGAALFVQTAASGTFTANPAAEATTPAADGVAGDYVLTLTGHSGHTIAFADRPNRNFAEVPTEQFLTGLGFPDDNPPNAALVTGDTVLLVELFTPAFDAESGSVTYGASILQGYSGEGLAPVAGRQQDQELVESFSAASLFIDDCPDANPLYCYTECYSDPVGNLGRRGMCWHWADFSCEPCSGNWSGTAAECNANFGACNGSCFTDQSGCDDGP